MNPPVPRLPCRAKFEGGGRHRTSTRHARQRCERGTIHHLRLARYARTRVTYLTRLARFWGGGGSSAGVHWERAAACGGERLGGAALTGGGLLRPRRIAPRASRHQRQDRSSSCLCSVGLQVDAVRPLRNGWVAKASRSGGVHGAAYRRAERAFAPRLAVRVAPRARRRRWQSLHAVCCSVPEWRMPRPPDRAGCDIPREGRPHLFGRAMPRRRAGRVSIGPQTDPF